MNYFAHLVLAESSAASKVGNLLGDFCKGVDLSTQPLAIQAGLWRHQQIDRFTDTAAPIQLAKTLFSPRYRRFAPVITDMLWDHLLLKHWAQLESRDLEQFIQQCYQQLWRSRDLMPPRMAQTMTWLVSQDWFGHYRELPQLGQALDNIAARLRFANAFAGSISEIERLLPQLEPLFLQFYPSLQQYVQNLGPELVAWQHKEPDRRSQLK